ncbi:MAG TPA: inositol monophosphatase [Candidatus Gallacutalibacter stercoravium]|nr:inositol monophosphatase [Candidatus Gallacutalibacter stercoravium]
MEGWETLSRETMQALQSQVEEAARQAGAFMLAYSCKPDGSAGQAEADETKEAKEAKKEIAVTVKEGHANYVTQVDVAVQNFLMDRLAKLLPHAGFLAEEEEKSRPKEQDLALYWVIDPIDGTTNFIRNLRRSAVSIGLVQEGRGLLGVVYNPYQDELFSAAVGEGARCNGQPIQAAHTELEDALIALGTSPYRRDLAERTMEAAKHLFLHCGDLRRTGSAALDLCDIAAGRIDGFFEAVLSPWDYAASSVILKEAGAFIGTLPPYTFGYTEPIPILAGGAVVFSALEQLLKHA